MVPCNFHIGMKYFVKDLFLTYNKNTSTENILEYCVLVVVDCSYVR